MVARNKYIDELAKTGWFEGLPAAARADAEERLAQSEPGDEWKAAVSIWQDRDGTAFKPSSILARFEAESYGLFASEWVYDGRLWAAWEAVPAEALARFVGRRDDSDSYVLAFACGGRTYAFDWSLPGVGCYDDWAALITSGMPRNEWGIEFHLVGKYNAETATTEDCGYVLTTPESLKRARRASLVPMHWDNRGGDFFEADAGDPELQRWLPGLEPSAWPSRSAGGLGADSDAAKPNRS